MGGRRALRPGTDARTARRAALWIMVPLAVATLVSLVWMWPGGIEREAQQGASAEFSGTVEKLLPQACEQPLEDDVNGCGQARVAIGDGAPKGVRSVELVRLPNGLGAPEIAVGDDVVMISTSSPDGTVIDIIDHDRSTGLVWLALAFVLAVVAFGRLSGLRALVGLCVTFGVLIWFVVPAILAGSSPTLVAVVGSAAIMLVVLYLTHGFSLTTTVAVAGTMVSLLLTGLLSALSVTLMHLTGVTDDITTAVGMGTGMDMQGLLLAGIVIGALGVLDDVTITQTATVGEVARANPQLGFLALYRAGGRVGRSHIASVINTIILAYAGSSLPLLLLLVAGNGSLGAIISDQVVAQEIVRSVVGTLGIIAAVPVTTALAALLAAKVPGAVAGEQGLGSGEGHGHTHAH